MHSNFGDHRLGALLALMNDFLQLQSAPVRRGGRGKDLPNKAPTQRHQCQVISLMF